MIFGKNGTYANLGIPGTGLSYRTRIGGSKGRAKSSGSTGQTAIRNICNYTGDPNYSFQTGITDAGDIVFLDDAGNEIKDSQLISLLKKHPQYKADKPQLEAEALAKSQAHADELRESTEAFLSIHALSPKIRTEADFKRRRAELRPKAYQEDFFAEAKPARSEVEARLRAEGESSASSLPPWRKQQEIDDCVSSRLEQQYQAELTAWQRSSEAHSNRQAAKRKEFEAKAQCHYKKQIRRMDAAIDGNPSYIDWAVGKWLTTCELPVSVSADYDYDERARRLSVDLDLPEIEELPKTYAVQMASGKFKEKDKTQKQLKEEYARCVLGLTLFVASNLFNVSPAIGEIVVSGYTARRDKAGAMKDEYIVSVRLPRAQFSLSGYAVREPEATILGFENRLNLTSTKIFKTIEPL